MGMRSEHNGVLAELTISELAAVLGFVMLRDVAARIGSELLGRKSRRSESGLRVPPYAAWA